MELNKDDIHTSINLRIITYYLIVKWKIKVQYHIQSAEK